MKKFIFVIIALVICLITVGTFWNLDTRKEHGFDKNQKELAKRDQKIAELEDSIRNMQARLDFYKEAVKWVMDADEEELDRVIKQVRSFPKDAPLP